MVYIKVARKKAEEERHRNILQVALDEFSRRGFYETDVDIIARRAGVGKGTVYRHFGNKRKLFLAVIEFSAESVNNKILSAVEGMSGALERLRKTLVVYANFFDQHRSMFRVLFLERFNFVEPVEKRFEDKIFRNIRLIEMFVRDGIKSGEFKQVDSYKSAVLIVGMLHGVIFDWLHSGADEGFTDRVSLMDEIIFHGLLK